MAIRIRFYSYFKELAGCAEANETLPEGSTLEDLWHRLAVRFPQLAPARQSALMAVGLDYQSPHYVLKAGDEVAFFPPVQGG